MNERDDDDDDETAFFDRSKRSKKATQRGHAAASERDREAYRKRAVELATPTVVNPVPPCDRSGDILVVSMKTPDHEQARREPDAKAHQVKLRALSEVSGERIANPQGFLAPPRDPRQARGRRIRDLVIWSCAVIVIGSIVMTAVWLIARG